jgi:hypothetical protein
MSYSKCIHLKTTFPLSVLHFKDEWIRDTWVLEPSLAWLVNILYQWCWGCFQNAFSNSCFHACLCECDPLKQTVLHSFAFENLALLLQGCLLFHLWVFQVFLQGIGSEIPKTFHDFKQIEKQVKKSFYSGITTMALSGTSNRFDLLCFAIS